MQYILKQVKKFHGLPTVSCGLEGPLEHLTNRKHSIAVIARCILDEGGLRGFLTDETQFENQDFRKTLFEEVPRKMYMKHIDELLKFIPNACQNIGGSGY